MLRDLGANAPLRHLLQRHACSNQQVHGGKEHCSRLPQRLDGLKCVLAYLRELQSGVGGGMSPSSRGFAKAASRRQPSSGKTDGANASLMGAYPSSARTAAKPPSQPAAAVPVQQMRGGDADSPAKAGEKRKRGPMGQPTAPTTPRNLRIAPISPNLIAEPYRGDPPKLPLTAYFTPAGWKERWQRILGGAKSVYTLAKCRRHLKPFGLIGFKKEALRLYLDINRMIAQGDRTALRHVITPGEMTNVKRQLKAREDGDWKRIEWSLVAEPSLRELEVVHGRLLAMDPKNDELTYAQLTVRIRATHRFAAYNARNQLVAGNMAAEVPVQDVWVLERSFNKAPHSKWRLAGRLGGVPPTAASTSWRERLSKLLYGTRSPVVAAS